MPSGSSTSNSWDPKRQHHKTAHGHGHDSQATTGYDSQGRLTEQPREQAKASKEADKEQKRKQRAEEKERKRREKYSDRKEREYERERAKRAKNARMRQEHDVGYADNLGVDPISDLRLVKRAAGVSIRKRLPGFRY